MVSQGVRCSGHAYYKLSTEDVEAIENLPEMIEGKAVLRAASEAVRDVHGTVMVTNRHCSSVASTKNPAGHRPSCRQASIEAAPATCFGLQSEVLACLQVSKTMEEQQTAAPFVVSDALTSRL